MSTTPSIFNKYGFAEFDESGCAVGLIEAVRYPRSHASALLAALPAKRASIEGNPNLNERGKDVELRQALRSFPRSCLARIRPPCDRPERFRRRQRRATTSLPTPFGPSPIYAPHRKPQAC